MLTQVTARQDHTHNQCAQTLGLAGMLHWHDKLEAQNTSPFMCASECQMDWSSKAPYQKRSIPLVCELGLLEWHFAKLEADEDYGEALQACARARMGGARQQNDFLCKAKA